MGVWNEDPGAAPAGCLEVLPGGPTLLTNLGRRARWADADCGLKVPPPLRKGPASSPSGPRREACGAPMPRVTVGGAPGPPWHFGRNERENAALDLATRANPGREFVRAPIFRPPDACSQDGPQTCGVPVGLILQPLAEATNRVPAVNWGTEKGSILRCSRCMAYMNPFVRWLDGGQRWACSLCGFAQPTEPSYFCEVDERGVRYDAEQRPELTCGTVDHIATREYTSRGSPEAPAFVFALDASRAACESGALRSAVAGVRAAVCSGSLQGGDRARVAVITYDSSVHLYRLRGGSPRRLSVADVDDVFLPVSVDELLVPLADGRCALLALLDALVAEQPRSHESCLDAAVRCGGLLLGGAGGKLMVVAAARPSCTDAPVGGAGLGARLAPTAASEAAQLLRPANNTAQELASTLAEARVSVDLFLAPRGYMDLASLAPLARGSGGEVHHYPWFSPEGGDGERLRADFARAATRSTAWQAELRLRVSCGWRVARVHGAFADGGRDHLLAPACHEDQSFAIALEPDGTEGSSLLCVQAALLHTTSCGDRLVRVHTWGTVTTSDSLTLLRSVDDAAAAAFLAAACADRALVRGLAGDAGGLRSARASLEAVVREAETAARNVEASARSAAWRMGAVGGAPGGGEEVLPRLPRYLRGLLRSPAFRAELGEIRGAGAGPAADARSFALARAASASAACAEALGQGDAGHGALHPEDCGRGVPPEAGFGVSAA